MKMPHEFRQLSYAVSAVSDNIDPSEIITDLVISSAFEPRSSSVEEKRLIFEKVWAESFSWLRNSFDTAGNRGIDNCGFGFLVEAFVRHSSQLPIKNTEKGEKAARMIISELHLGKRGQINLGSQQSNSDFLGVKLMGRRITITAIGEVKSSHKVAMEKIGGQLKRQEKSLEILVKEHKASKSEKSVKGFFEKRGIVVSDDFEKFLVLPFGEGEALKHNDGFSSWQIVEIEFSYNELVFIAQKIWPDFRPDVKFYPGKLANLFQIAAKFDENWVKNQIDQDFGGLIDGFGPDNPPPYLELGLFFLATGKTPLLEDNLLGDGIRWSAELVQKSFWPAVQRCLNFFINSTPHPEADFSEREKKIFERFWYLLTSNRADLEHFIYFLKSLNGQIKCLARSQHQLGQLKAMSEIWTI